MPEKQSAQSFELEAAIAAWLQAVASCSSGATRAAAVDELEDHLRSEIAAQLRLGAEEETAFHQARQRMGDSELLASEFAKNRSLLALLCQAEQRLVGSVQVKSRRLGLLVIVQSLVWAAVMIAASAIVPEASSSLSNLLIAGWFAGTMLPLALLDMRHSARSEWACLKRWWQARVA